MQQKCTSEKCWKRSAIQKNAMRYNTHTGICGYLVRGHCHAGGKQHTMATELTFVMLKPDAVQRGLVTPILERFLRKVCAWMA